jgi:hypothetical protein
MVKRSKALDERILESLAEGVLVTVMCRDGDKMPSIRQLQRWRRDDAEFDDKAWSAEGRGLMIQRSELIESMHEAIKTSGPGSGTRIQGLHNLLHENGRVAGRLVARMSDRVKVSSDVTHIIIGWESAGDIIDALPSDSLPPGPINGRPHITHPRKLHSESEEASAIEDHVDG